MHFEEVELLAVYRYPKSTAISVNKFFLHMLSCVWQAFKYQSSLKLNKWQSNSEIQKWFFYGRKIFISSGINRSSKVASEVGKNDSEYMCTFVSIPTLFRNVIWYWYKICALSVNFPVEAEGTAGNRTPTKNLCSENRHSKNVYILVNGANNKILYKGQVKKQIEDLLLTKFLSNIFPNCGKHFWFYLRYYWEYVSDFVTAIAIITSLKEPKITL